jgi:hypothetical protein
VNSGPSVVLGVIWLVLASRLKCKYWVLKIWSCHLDQKADQKILNSRKGGVVCSGNGEDVQLPVCIATTWEEQPMTLGKYL